MVFLACCISSVAFSTNTLKTKKHELSQLAHQIYLIKQKLFSAKSKQSNLRSELKHTEIKMGVYSKKIRRTQKEIQKQQQTLRATEKKLRSHQNDLQKQMQLLAKQVRTAYLFGQRPFVKILLNQEDPATITRNLEYYRYFNQARLSLIHQIKKTMQVIQETLKHIQNQTIQLQKIKATQSHQKNKLRIEQSQRKIILTHINHDINNKHEQLKKLIGDKANLEKVIKRLNEEKTLGYIPGQTFHDMRHKLPWPIHTGHIIRAFGQTSFNGRIRSTGILMKAPEGTPIHAVFPGKVIFADWLHGFGQMIIIQHGSKYMTLYAHLQSLYVKTNENIKIGQTIATVGDTGGQRYSALYFEIRYKGSTPLDPINWLRKR